jgi:hypothetical protein
MEEDLPDSYKIIMNKEDKNHFYKWFFIFWFLGGKKCDIKNNQ